MLFPTIDFALFFLLVFSVAWLGALRRIAWARKAWLLAASLFFYGYWDWRFVGLLLLSANTAWAAGWIISRTDSERWKSAVMVACVALQLTILGFFKYYGFFLEELAPILDHAGLSRDLYLFNVILPVGISFFTFQALSYVIDLRRGHIAQPASWLDMNLYVSFFPQLVAGPIVRARTFLPQLAAAPRLTRRAATLGGLLILLGLLKKMVIAQHLAVELADPVFQSPDYWGGQWVLLGVYAYAVQIYCDFSGYSDIAIGVALLFGYRFSKNFDRPYSAASFRDFWRRWHISLSSWLRDYLYIPLGGSRLSPGRTADALLTTMLLGGLWHGANWTFLIWGGLHGVYLVAERAARRSPRPQGSATGRWMDKWLNRTIGWFIVFHLVCAAWIFFRSETLDGALLVFQQLAAMRWDEGPYFESLTATTAILLVVGPLIAQQFKLRRLTATTVNLIARAPAWALGLAAGLALAALNAVAPSGVAPFIYFQF